MKVCTEVCWTAKWYMKVRRVCLQLITAGRIDRGIAKPVSVARAQVGQSAHLYNSVLVIEYVALGCDRECMITLGTCEAEHDLDLL